mgnify:CR=1 FL=1
MSERRGVRLEWFLTVWAEKKEQIFLFAAVLLLGYGAVRVLLALAGNFLRRSAKISAVASGFFLSVLRILLYLVYLIALLALLGIPTASLVAILSVFGLSLSLALQSALSDFAGGMMIIATEPFEVGDYVEIDGVGGIVRSITIVNTCLVTPDSKVVTVPNSRVSSANVINFSRNPERRLDLNFMVVYGSPVEKVKQILTDVAQSHTAVLRNREILARLSRWEESGLAFLLRVWVRNPDYFTVSYDLNERVLAAFEEMGVEIPFPQLEVRLRGAGQGDFRAGKGGG